MLPELLTVKGRALDAPFAVVTTKFPVPGVHVEPSCTTISWYQRWDIPHPVYAPVGGTTRRQFSPFHVTVELPWDDPKESPYSVTYAPETPLTLSPPLLGPL